MLVSKKIVVTYHADPGEVNVPWPTLKLESDGKRLSVPCDGCDVRCAYRFVPTAEGDSIDFCLECVSDMPDVIKIVIGE